MTRQALADAVIGSVRHRLTCVIKVVHLAHLCDRETECPGLSERLGHSTIAMTMDIYAHVLPAMDRDAAEAIGRALG
jgi:integrase